MKAWFVCHDMGYHAAAAAYYCLRIAANQMDKGNNILFWGTRLASKEKRKESKNDDSQFTTIITWTVFFLTNFTWLTMVLYNEWRLIMMIIWLRRTHPWWVLQKKKIIIIKDGWSKTRMCVSVFFSKGQASRNGYCEVCCISFFYHDREGISFLC